jgi:hypothetical protein
MATDHHQAVINFLQLHDATPYETRGPTASPLRPPSV